MSDAKHVVGVAVVLQRASNACILLQHRKKNPGSGLYVLPGGRLEAEDSQVGCAREIEEELGLKLHPSRLRPVYHASDKLGTGESLIMLYFSCSLYEAEADQIQNMEPEKCHGLEWRAPHQLGGMPMWQNDREAVRAYVRHY